MSRRRRHRSRARLPGTPALILVAALLATMLAMLPGADAGAVAGAGPGATAPARAAATGTTWLCRPGLASPDCAGDLATTVEHRDGTSRVVHPDRRRPAPVDCFYVYPTASLQPTPNALPLREPLIREVARQQVKQFSSLCRVFAPVYRQRSLVALGAEDATTTAQKARANKTAYRDVLAAWRSYLRTVAPHRGVVLVGHSQGSRLLRRLIREEIDPRPALRRRLVSAVLPGANVLVRRGRDHGGDFDHVRVCHRATQTGCVMAWSTFGQRPPSDSRFGRPSGPSVQAGLGLPTGRRYRVVCTNPASLAANHRRATHQIAISEPVPGPLTAVLVLMYGGLPPSAATPYVVPAERYTARCETSGGLRVLRLRPIAGARTLRPVPDATWGLHLLDVTLVLGDVLRVVGRQVDAWTARR